MSTKNLCLHLKQKLCGVARMTHKDTFSISPNGGLHSINTSTLGIGQMFGGCWGFFFINNSYSRKCCTTFKFLSIILYLSETNRCADTKAIF